MEIREEITGHQFKHQKLRPVLTMAMMGFTFTASIIFIIFSYSSLIPMFLSNLTTFFPGRNYMFFISNFLLALIVKTSGLITNLSPNKDNDTKFSVKPINKQVYKSGGSGSGSIVSPSGSSVTFLEMKAPSSVGVVEEDEQGTGNNGVMVAVKEVAAAAAPEKSQEEEEEIQDEENRLISIDELHKKCDDFIKMMKGGVNSMELKPRNSY